MMVGVSVFSLKHYNEYILQKHTPQSGLTDRIVFSVKTIEPSKRGVSVHVQRVHTQIIRRQIETLKELRQCDCRVIGNVLTLDSGIRSHDVIVG